MIEGTLNKWTNYVKGWQLRYFVLDDVAGVLSYYTVREELLCRKRIFFAVVQSPRQG